MTELIGMEGRAGDFAATLVRRPRYVDESRCTACGDCVSKCPYQADDTFDLGLRKRKAIYMYFPQAVPSSALIDREACQYFKTGKCRICEKVCKSRAINFKDRKKRIRLKVGAVVLATGFEPYDVSRLAEYGGGSISNVVTALQFERMLSASGPTGGEVITRRGSRAPESIAFIQCVGSRDDLNKSYCSAVCCMHATKQAMLAVEHHPGIRISIFYTDMRSPGKGFQEYVNKAKSQYGIEYIRSRPGRLTDENGKVAVHYDDMASRAVKKMTVDLVVLSTALVPGKDNSALAAVLGVELDANGFTVSPNPALPFSTTVPGIVACGYCSAPQDIPDSVTQSSAAAAKVAEMLESLNVRDRRKARKTG